MFLRHTIIVALTSLASVSNAIPQRCRDYITCIDSQNSCGVSYGGYVILYCWLAQNPYSHGKMLQYLLAAEFALAATMCANLYESYDNQHNKLRQINRYNISDYFYYVHHKRF
ncbi:hypothetical protein S7711_10798 [Stachybotrys chartarum IBT 7711]|uniref:Uncharacterized protein n=1 Tax=Stachybotrys chartarum (strain CBS 109288 / IBT 7711) TaxID=1280523 RepID=A0A084AXI6_STACB|nr:hypothetical protein S7711_10798 [Stachybotrys chartarum IBT 7711]KFA50799.1 hypothetical protein S40293_11030 [Stachybotrys chartarum IBT 40293]